jgi:hypothetical protein
MSIFIAVSYLTDWVIVAGELQKSSAAAQHLMRLR